MTRFVRYAALMGLWGACGYLAILVPRGLALDVAERLNTTRVAALILAIIATAVSLPFETAIIGDGWNDALEPDILRAVLFQTSVGRAWQIQGVAAVLLAATLPKRLRPRTGLTAVAAGLALIALTFTGHAAMHEGWFGIAHQVNDAMHLLAGGAWFGALVPLVPILRGYDDSETHREAGLALRRFSLVGHAAVVLVLATGVLNVSLILEKWPFDLSSAYQVLLTTKIGVVMTMTGLALINRYVVVPRLVSHEAQSARAVRAITLTEVALSLVAIALVSVFGLLEPD